MNKAEHNWGHPIAYHPALARHFGSVNAAILFCQLRYWLDRCNDERGVYKTADDWEEETGLSYREQATARKILSEKGYLIEEHKRLEHRIFFKIDWLKFNSDFEITERRKRNSGSAENAVRETTKAQSVNSTEITTETTTESTAQAKPAKSPEITFDKFIEQRKSEGLSAIEETDPVWDVIDSLKMPDEFAVLQWRYLESQYSTKKNGKAKRYKQWPLVLKKSLSELWGNLFYKSEAGWVLTSKGKNLKELAE